MAKFNVQISQVVTNGPYSVLIFKDGAGLKDTNSIASISAALDQVKTDVGANLAGETVRTVSMVVNTS